MRQPKVSLFDGNRLGHLAPTAHLLPHLRAGNAADSAMPWDISEQLTGASFPTT